MKPKPYTRLKKLFNLSRKELSAITGISQSTITTIQRGTCSPDLLTITGWFVDAVELLSKEGRGKLLKKMKIAGIKIGTTAKTVLLLLEAIQLMTKWEAANFIRSINNPRN